MAEYIERDEAIRKAQDACIKIVFRVIGRGITQFDAADIVDVMESVPVADVVEVKHGHWEKQNFIIFDSEKVGYRCSGCNTTWDTNTNYCPNCGTKMDGKDVAK